MILGHDTLDGRTGHEAGRALLAKLYLQQTGEVLPPIETNPWGKPFFADSTWHFSISHTKRHVFCALAKQPIGIDAEELGRRVSSRLPGRVLSPEELRQYEAAPDKAKAFLTLWVLKEAAAKLSGKGLQGFPSHTNFSLSDPRVREIDGCLVAVLGEEDVI